MISRERFTETLGWIGVVFVILAYALVLLNQLSPYDLSYLFLNLFGAIFIAIDAREDGNSQSVVSNTIWAIFAIIGIVRYFIL